jgi:uncharacterized integral membrane protein
VYRGAGGDDWKPRQWRAFGRETGASGGLEPPIRSDGGSVADGGERGDSGRETAVTPISWQSKGRDMSQGTDDRTERERLIFGAGFVFGVMFTLLILALVFAAVVPERVSLGAVLSSTVVLPLVAAVGFAAAVGSALYVLALPDRGLALRRGSVFREEEPEFDTE